MRKIKTTLRDQHAERKTKIPATISLNNGSIYIKPEGYEDKHGGQPIMIECYDGDLRVLVWSDINAEDPTHIISLSEAREEKRI